MKIKIICLTCNGEKIIEKQVVHYIEPGSVVMKGEMDICALCNGTGYNEISIWNYIKLKILEIWVKIKWRI
jgi:Fe-S cluster assembly ATPase SufC